MFRKLKYLDKTLLIITIPLFILGLIMIFSASNITAYRYHDVSTYHYFIRQSIFLAVGLVLFIIMIIFNTETYCKVSHLLMLGGIAALVAVLVYGSIKKGVQGWFVLGPFTIQPSEFIKVITIVYLAEYYGKHQETITSWVKSLFPIGITILIAGLIFIQPDLGTAIIYVGIVAAIFFSAPISKKIKGKIFFLGLILIIVSLIGGKSLLKEHQLERLNIKNPCDRILTNGSQVCNCYIAINNGGLTGVGLGNSTQKYLYLPEPYTDFIYAIIVEELGLIVGVGLILVYILIMFRILVIGRKSPTNKGAILCYGVAIYLFLHVAVNLLGIMGIIPLTGVPLPFMSYGGSFTICLIAALTIVQRVSIDSGLIKERSEKHA